MNLAWFACAFGESGVAVRERIVAALSGLLVRGEKELRILNNENVKRVKFFYNCKFIFYIALIKFAIAFVK